MYICFPDDANNTRNFPNNNSFNLSLLILEIYIELVRHRNILQKTSCLD